MEIEGTREESEGKEKNGDHDPMKTKPAMRGKQERKWKRSKELRDVDMETERGKPISRETEQHGDTREELQAENKVQEGSLKMKKLKRNSGSAQMKSKQIMS